MESLKPVNEHRPVCLSEHVWPHFDCAVWPNADEVSVEGGMVEATERHPVPNRGFAQGVSVRDDVRRLEEFIALQPANRAVVLIGTNHTLTERGLMKSLPE